MVQKQIKFIGRGSTVFRVSEDIGLEVFAQNFADDILYSWKRQIGGQAFSRVAIEGNRASLYFSFEDQKYKDPAVTFVREENEVRGEYPQKPYPYWTQVCKERISYLLDTRDNWEEDLYLNRQFDKC